MAPSIGGWTRAVRRRCVDLLQAHSTHCHFNRISAVTVLEEVLLESPARQQLTEQHSDTAGLLLQVQRTGLEVEGLRECIASMAHIIPLDKALQAIAEQPESVTSTQPLLALAESRLRKESRSSSATPHVLSSLLQICSAPGVTPDVSKKARHLADVSVELLLTDSPSPEMLLRIIGTSARQPSGGGPRLPQKAQTRQGLKRKHADLLFSRIASTAQGGGFDPKQLTALLRHMSEYAVLNKPGGPFWAALFSVIPEGGGGGGGSSSGIKPDDFRVVLLSLAVLRRKALGVTQGKLDECFVEVSRRVCAMQPELSGADASALATAGAVFRDKSLITYAMRQLQTGALWSGVTEALLTQLTLSAAATRHVAMLDSISQRVTEFHEPIAKGVSIGMRTAVKILISIAESNYMEHSPVQCRALATCLCETIAVENEDAIESGAPDHHLSPQEISRSLVTLGRLHILHAPLMRTILETPRDATTLPSFAWAFARLSIPHTAPAPAHIWEDVRKGFARLPQQPQVASGTPEQSPNISGAWQSDSALLWGMLRVSAAASDSASFSRGLEACCATTLLNTRVGPSELAPLLTELLRHGVVSQAARGVAETALKRCEAQSGAKDGGVAPEMHRHARGSSRRELTPQDMARFGEVVRVYAARCGAGEGAEAAVPDALLAWEPVHPPPQAWLDQPHPIYLLRKI